MEAGFPATDFVMWTDAIVPCRGRLTSTEGGFNGHRGPEIHILGVQKCVNIFAAYYNAEELCTDKTSLK